MREVNMSKKRYPDEFKIEAVKQVVDAGHSVADVAGVASLQERSRTGIRGLMCDSAY
jgi:transposase-like protein